MKQTYYTQQKQPYHPDIAKSWDFLGSGYRHLKQYKQAIKAHKQAAYICQSHYGEHSHTDKARALDGQGLVYLAQKAYGKAAQCFQQAFDIKRQLYRDQASHPDIADAFVYLGNVCAHQPQEALYFYGEALKIYEKVHKTSTHHLDLVNVRIRMGKAHAQLKEFDKAIICYAQATCAQVARFRIENQIDAQINIYICTNTTEKKKKRPNEQLQPLFQQVDTFIQHPTNNLMLLHGDAGVGKSIYGRLLEKKLWDSCQDHNDVATIPLFIPLPALKDPNNAIQETLITYGWDIATIDYLKKLYQQPLDYSHDCDKEERKYSEKDEKTSAYGARLEAKLKAPKKLLVILDGYDEIRSKAISLPNQPTGSMGGQSHPLLPYRIPRKFRKL